MWKTFVLAILGAMGLTFAAGTLLGGEREHRGGHEEHEHGRTLRLVRGRDVAAAANPKYREQCGSCHFAYPAGLLPAASWERIMGNLADHFGENAELPAADTAELTAYLSANAADSGAAVGRSVAFARSADGAPLRITETAYFQREHRELPRRAVQDNPQVGSFSNCNACHTRAAEGSFNEHEVVVPGFGRWED